MSKKEDVEVIHGVVDGNKPGAKIKVNENSVKQFEKRGLVKRLPVKNTAKKESAPKKQTKTTKSKTEQKPVSEPKQTKDETNQEGQ